MVMVILLMRPEGEGNRQKLMAVVQSLEFSNTGAEIPKVELVNAQRNYYLKFGSARKP